MYNETIAALIGISGPTFNDITTWDHIVIMIENGTIAKPIDEVVFTTNSYERAMSKYHEWEKEYAETRSIVWIAKRTRDRENAISPVPMWILVEENNVSHILQ
jgi:hypothetical protein